MLKEFKEFALRGNVMDMAIGVIIGAAFSKVVTSVVNDMLMPPLGALMGQLDFKEFFWDLSGSGYQTVDEATKAGAPIIKYGFFLNVMIDFVIVAFVVFLLVKQINRLRRPAAVAAPTTKNCPRCCLEIPLKATRCGHCTSELAA